MRLSERTASFFMDSFGEVQKLICLCGIYCAMLYLTCMPPFVATRLKEEDIRGWFSCLSI